MTLKNHYSNSNVLITGGNGFIGANLTEILVKLGANVTVFTNIAQPGWEKKFKINGKTNTVIGDITSKKDTEKVVQNMDFVFHLAGISGATESNERSLLDMQINCGGVLTLLEACRKKNQRARILFPSSQLVYGQANKLPVAESHSTEPTSIYGIHRLTVDKYIVLYNKVFGLKTVALRIPNPYGPRQSMDHTYGIVNYFIGRVLAGNNITIYGEGNQMRDYIYIEDLIEAMLISNASPESIGKVYNVGSGKPHQFKEMAEKITKVIGIGDIKHVEFPKNAAKSEVGDIYLDIGKIKEELGWEPSTKLEDGIRKTIAYYKKSSIESLA